MINSIQFIVNTDNESIYAEDDIIDFDIIIKSKNDNSTIKFIFAYYNINELIHKLNNYLSNNILVLNINNINGNAFLNIKNDIIKFNVFDMQCASGLYISKKLPNNIINIFKQDIKIIIDKYL